MVDMRCKAELLSIAGCRENAETALAKSARVFITYSRDSQSHAETVIELSERLRRDGVDAWLDLYTTAPEEGWPRWIQRQIEEADYVLMLCKGGHGPEPLAANVVNQSKINTWEDHIINQLLYNNNAMMGKLLPIVLDKDSYFQIPQQLQHFTVFRLPSDYERLYRYLTDQEAEIPRLWPVRVVPSSEEGARRRSQPPSGRSQPVPNVPSVRRDELSQKLVVSAGAPEFEQSRDVDQPFLLISMLYEKRELRAWFERNYPGSVSDALPGPAAPSHKLVADVVELLGRNAGMRERFFDYLEQAFPDQLGYIREVRQKWSSSYADYTDGDRLTASEEQDFWSDFRGPWNLLHRANPAGSLPIWSSILLIFLPNEREQVVWRRLPARLLAQAKVDCDIFYAPVGPVTPERLQQFESDLQRFASKYKHMAFVVGQDSSLVEQLLARELSEAVADGLLPHNVEKANHLLSLRTRLIIQITSASALELHAPANPGPQAADAPEHLYAQRIKQLAAWQLPRPEWHSLPGPIEPGSLTRILNRLCNLFLRPELMLARESVGRTFDLDCAGHIGRLISSGPSSAEPLSERTAQTAAFAGTQSEVCERVVSCLESRRPGPYSIVVTGDAGVGKSAVLRMITRQYALQILKEPGGNSPLPVYLPCSIISIKSALIDRFTLAPPEQRPEFLLELLLNWWAEWVNNLTFSNVVSREWLLRKILSEPTLLILDGVDEFLTNHPRVPFGDFVGMLKWLQREVERNRQFYLLIGVRSNLTGLAAMASDESFVYEILRLNLDQVRTHFPAVGALLSVVRERKLLFTPLILAQLDAHTIQHWKSKAPTHAEIIDAALRAVIVRSDICRLVIHESGAESESDEWIFALMVIAWVCFTTLRASIELDSLLKDIAAMRDSWEKFSQGHTRTVGCRLFVRGCNLVLEAHSRGILLRRTILYSTARGAIFFQHREWLDFLTAKYFAEALMVGKVDELGRTAFGAAIYAMAAEVLGNREIERVQVEEVFRQTAELNNPFIGANFTGLIGNTSAPMSRPAIGVILDQMGRMAPIEKVVTTTGLGRRVLRNMPEDLSWRELRNALHQFFLQNTASETAVDPVISSLAWCYLKAFQVHFNLSGPTRPWNNLGADERHEKSALVVICDISKPYYDINKLHRATQMAFLQIQDLLLECKHRPISAVHYLYYLVVAHKHGVAVREVVPRLRAVIQSDSPVSARIKDYTIVPELWSLFERCRILFEMTER